MLTARFQFRLLDLTFDSFAFPTSCHTPYSTAAKEVQGYVIFQGFRGMVKVRLTYAREDPQGKDQAWRADGGVRRRLACEAGEIDVR
jgi:hypothetical protein